MKNLLFLFLILAFAKTASSESLSTYLIQDPARTSDNRKVDPNKNLSGSTGRYKNDHKHANGKNFATKKRHIKTVKPSGDNGKEKETAKPKGSESRG